MVISVFLDLLLEPPVTFSTCMFFWILVTVQNPDLCHSAQRKHLSLTQSSTYSSSLLDSFWSEDTDRSIITGLLVALNRMLDRGTPGPADLMCNDQLTAAPPGKPLISRSMATHEVHSMAISPQAIRCPVAFCACFDDRRMGYVSDDHCLCGLRCARKGIPFYLAFLPDDGNSARIDRSNSRPF